MSMTVVIVKEDEKKMERNKWKRIEDAEVHVYFHLTGKKTLHVQ